MHQADLSKALQPMKACFITVDNIRFDKISKMIRHVNMFVMVLILNASNMHLF